MNAKRTPVWLAAAMILAVGVVKPVRAFLPPARPQLQDFDRRLAAPPANEPLTAAQAQLLADLIARVPGLEIKTNAILATPGFLSSRLSFLSGPQAQGLGIRPESAQAIPAADPHRAVKAFLNERAALFGFNADILKAARVKRDYVTERNGLRTVVWEQQLDGIPVYQAVITANITRRGELVNLGTYFVPQLAAAANAGVPNRAAVQAAPPISAAQAIVNAAHNVGEANLTLNQVMAAGPPQGAERKQQFSATSALPGTTHAQLLWLPMNRSVARLCWRIVLNSGRRGEMLLLLVDAVNGEVLVRRNLTRHLTNATYHVFTSDSPSPFSPGWPTPNVNQPPLVPRTLLTIDALNTNASPNGWINDGDNTTSGNNVDAFLDRDGDLQPDVPTPQGVPFRVFDFPQDLATDPTNYIEASIVQLFYINNRYHDVTYGFGFTEASGNFQSDNFGRGGVDQDPIQAMTLWGEQFGIANNATMSTPPDGISPLMRMFVFDGPNPRRDSSVDSDVILHEHTHGITERTIGGGVGVNYFGQSGAIHEGNSDFFALTTLSEAPDDLGGNYPEGGYVSFELGAPFIPPFHENYYFGIRRYPYSTNMLKNPLTYKDIDPTQADPHTGIPANPVFGGGPADEVHNAGEVWCVTLWEMRVNLVVKHGWTNGNALALQLVYDGMRLSPPNPNFLQLRDAILQADQVDTGGQNQMEIWRAFAKRGMGGSATSPDSSTTIGVVEAFDLPGLNYVAAVVNDTFTGNGNSTLDYNECAELDIVLRNSTTAQASNIIATLSTTNAYVTVVDGTSAYPALAPGALGINLSPFRVYTAPDFPCGTPIWFEMVIRSDQDTRTNLFVLNTGFVSLNLSQFHNTTPLDIPDDDLTGVVSPLEVFGLTDPIGRVTVSLYLEHTWPGDLALTLIAPDGTEVALVRNRGGLGSGFGLACDPDTSRTTFDDRARVAIDQGFQPWVGRFRPEEPLSAFNGKTDAAINGVWQLKVVDSARFDVGTLQCWSLKVFPIQCTEGRGPCAPDLVLTATDSPDPVLVGSNLTYTVTVNNTRPVEARGVVVSNVLPASVTLVSVTNSQGTFSLFGPLLRINFGIISNEAPATADIVVRPTEIGVLTNTFQVGATNRPMNPLDDTAVVVTTVEQRAPLIVAAGAALIGESQPNGAIDPGETVTLNLFLRNIGSAGTTNLEATLLETNGVTLSSGTQAYGALLPFADPVFKEFEFVAAGAFGDTVTAVLHLVDGTNDLGLAEFNFTLSDGGVFANPSGITINDAAVATPYPSIITVSGVSGVLRTLDVTLNKFSHNFPDDVDILLVGPQGQTLLLMSDAGGGHPLDRQTLRFVAGAIAPLPDSAQIFGGDWLPTDYAPADVFPDAPDGPYGQSLDVFLGTDPNGPWSLYVYDDNPVDDGAITGGWSLNLTTISPVNTRADLRVSVQDTPDPVLVGELLTYTVTVENAGPDAATSVLLQSRLPDSVDVLATDPPTGMLTNGWWQFELGTLTNGALATVTIQVTPRQAGRITNLVQVSAAELDLNLANSSATAETLVNAPSADLAVFAANTPDPAHQDGELTYLLTVTNQGPDTAAAVWVSNTLPAEVTYVSAKASQGSVSQANGVVVAELGALPSGASADLTIQVMVNSVGLITNRVLVGSSAADPVSANNATNLITTVSPALAVVVAAGVAITNDANQAIDPGEEVTVFFGLRNVGTADATNLTATLLATNGVVPVSPDPQLYGTLLAEGPVVGRPFTFSNDRGDGENITAVLQLREGAGELPPVEFEFSLSRRQSFTNQDNIMIALAGPAAPYPSTLTVEGIDGPASRVAVTLNGLSHTYPQDIDILLESPTHTRSLVMSDAGSGTPVSNLTLTLDPSAETALPANAQLRSGTFLPSDYSPADAFPAPAPAGPYAADFGTFVGSDPNGTWSLYVVDDSGGDQGDISRGWTLDIISATPVPVAADLAVRLTTATNQVSASQPMTLSLAVTNHGPGTATDVVLTHQLPNATILLSSHATQGEFSVVGQEVILNIGELQAGQGATATLEMTPTTTGDSLHTATVTAAETDPNPDNNTAQLNLTVTPPVSGPLVTLGSTWRYQDSGEEVAPTWLELGFDDSGWPAGPAILGFGRGDEATVIEGGLPTNRVLTTYFRQVFHVYDAGVYSNLTLRVLRDDGALVFLNGEEVFRDNLPAGPIDATTMASANVTGLEEQLYFAGSVPLSALRDGDNVLAVEVHQSSRTSHDLGFDLELLGNAGFSNQLPQVTLTQPADGSVLPVQRLDLTATALDPDGVVTRVEYYAGAQLLGEATAPPYAVTSPELAPGQYTLHARAIDNSNQARDSETVEVTVVAPPDTLVEAGAVWRYLDNGLDQGTNWIQLLFDDGTWPEGQAELGFGSFPVTGINPGPATNRFVTYYFRERFVLPPGKEYTFLQLDLKRQHGAVVYLNGAEVYRSNMPTGTVAYATLARTNVPAASSELFELAFLDATKLVAGTNLLAVEVHQSSITSSNLSFDLRLSAFEQAVPIVSGPLVPLGAFWRYHDYGTNAGTNWQMLEFDDSTWTNGPAILGFGRDDVSTEVNGGSPTNHFITTYFRHTFDVQHAGVYLDLRLRVLLDDGAVVYLNGVEVFRRNMPLGPVDEYTLALTDISGLAEHFYFSASVDPGLLLSGQNVLAAEIHQHSPTNQDLGFDLELAGNMGQASPPAAPRLQWVWDGDQLRLVWPVIADGYKVETATSLDAGAVWSLVPEPVAINGDFNQVSISPSPNTQRYYRLRWR